MKRALLVGLNAYPDPANTLRGCINDVRQVGAALGGHYAFPDEGIRVLLDGQATTRRIQTGLEWLVSGSRAGDVLVFHYSGHGSQVRDPHGDERTDGLDEIICPYDLDWSHPFTDDDLHDIVKVVPPGANLTVILDCCHAGTGLRELPRADGRDDAGPRDSRPRCLPARDAFEAEPDVRHRRQLAQQRLEARLTRFGQRAAEAGALLVAACRDDQVSADAFIDGDYHGALTYYFCNALRKIGYAVTYEELVREVRRLLRSNGFDQVPQLEGPAAARRSAVFTALSVGV